MVSKAAAIMARFPDAVPSRDFIVSAADGVQTIDLWDAVAIGHPAPTAEDLAEWELLIKPPPKWTSYQAAVSTAPGVGALLATCLSPQVAAIGGAQIYGGLVVGLGQIATGGSMATFLTAWNIARASGLVSAEVVAEMVTLAEPFNLPAEFLAALTAPGSMGPL
jgi:hypothetical protein